jgi:hypothetical protein
VVFAGKAASAYHTAKLIQLIHDVGRVVNSDARVGDRLKVVFLPNYSVSWPRSSSRRPTCRSRSPPPAPRPRAPAT